MPWRPEVDLHGHPLALHLARQELAGSADQWLSAADWQERVWYHRRTLRSFGVVVAASADGLHQLDRHLYRPLRDASFRAVKLLDDQVRERTRPDDSPILEGSPASAARHCCIEPECAGEPQQSGGSPSWKGAKKGSNHSTVPMICRL